MCLVAVAWRTHPDYPLIVAANRDEFHARPTRPADWWPDRPAIAAGRDLKAGGTWMGVSRSGRFAALTNYREMVQTDDGAPSRGELVADFLDGSMSAAAYCRDLDMQAYAGFSLILGDGDAIWFCSNRGDRPPGPVGQYTLVRISSDARRSPFSASPRTLSALPLA